ncbi:hypothetical protein DTO271G3_145 [Paecilomyces variotii]|nr:hypothetical protein DTO271G3_145 [Paecilomyces variotii]
MQISAINSFITSWLGRMVLRIALTSVKRIAHARTRAMSRADSPSNVLTALYQEEGTQCQFSSGHSTTTDCGGIPDIILADSTFRTLFVRRLELSGIIKLDFEVKSVYKVLKFRYLDWISSTGQASNTSIDSLQVKSTRKLRYLQKRVSRAPKSFLGIIGITRRWIKNFAELARPLYRLTGKAECLDGANEISERDTAAAQAAQAAQAPQAQNAPQQRQDIEPYQHSRYSDVLAFEPIYQSMARDKPEGMATGMMNLVLNHYSGFLGI